MLFKMLCVLLFTTMIAQYGQPAELERAAQRLEWMKATEPSAQGETAADRSRETVYSKGILERSFRLRSRLNTHLLMLKFRR